MLNNVFACWLVFIPLIYCFLMLICFQNQLFKENVSGTLSECQTLSIKIRTEQDRQSVGWKLFVNVISRYLLKLANWALTTAPWPLPFSHIRIYNQGSQVLVKLRRQLIIRYRPSICPCRIRVENALNTHVIRISFPTRISKIQSKPTFDTRWNAVQRIYLLTNQ